MNEKNKKYYLILKNMFDGLSNAKDSNTSSLQCMLSVLNRENINLKRYKKDTDYMKLFFTLCDEAIRIYTKALQTRNDKTAEDIIGLRNELFSTAILNDIDVIADGEKLGM